MPKIPSAVQNAVAGTRVLVDLEPYRVSFAHKIGKLESSVRNRQKCGQRLLWKARSTLSWYMYDTFYQNANANWSW